MDERSRAMIEDLFDAFNRRDQEGIVAVCHEDMEFFAVTAGQVGRGEPYVGPTGLRAYFADVSAIWEELLITPKEVEQREDGSILVQGRVYLRSRELGIRDMPVGWIWEVRGDRFARGRVYVDPEEAVRAFSRAETPGQSLDLDGSRSMTRLR